MQEPKFFSDGVYRVGNGISAPRVLYSSPPEYPLEAAKKQIEGMVQLYATIGEDGVPRDLRVTRSLDPELDQIAMGCVRGWVFQPGQKRPALFDVVGVEEIWEPVPVAATIEVNFQLPTNLDNPPQNRFLKTL